MTKYSRIVLQAEIVLIITILLLLVPQQVHAQTTFENVVEAPQDSNIIFQTINEPCHGGSSKTGVIELANDSHYFCFAFNGGEDGGTVELRLDGVGEYISMTFPTVPRYTIAEIVTIWGVPDYNGKELFALTVDTRLSNATNYNLTVWHGNPEPGFFTYVNVTDREYITITQIVTTTIWHNETITMSVFGDPNLWIPIFGAEIILAVLVYIWNKDSKRE